MKQIYFLLVFMMLGVFSLRAQTTTPEDGKKYQIMHVATQKFLSLGDITAPTTTSVRVSPFEGGADNDDQCFYFQPDGLGNYYIKNVQTGAFLYWTNVDDYTMGWSATSSGGTITNPNAAIFQIVPIEGTGTVYLANVGRINSSKPTQCYVGTNDMNTPTVYCNKDITVSAQEPYLEWQIMTPMASYSGALLMLLIQADEILTETDGMEGFSEDLRNAVEDALYAGWDVYDNANATQPEIDAAAAALQTALNSFTAFTPEAGAIYNIISYACDLVVGKDLGNNRAAIQTPTGADNQKILILPVDGKPNVYHFQSLDGQYIAVTSANGNIYDMYFSNYEDVYNTNGTRDARVEYSIRWFSGNIYEIISSLDPGNILGVNTTSDGSDIYANKAESLGDLAHWQFTVVGYTGMKAINKSDANVYVTGKDVNINQLTGNNVISVYTVTGQLISVTNSSGNLFTTTLNTGTYIVKVRGDNNFSKLVVVN